MNHLTGCEIVVGVSGGIAAYKSAEIVRLLKKEGAGVSVVMTRHAAEFVTPLTFQTLSERPVHIEMFAASVEPYISHITLAEKAVGVLIAPATANIIGKTANGIADDLLSTLLLVVRCPLFIAPAMNTKMYSHPAVQENLEKLQARGVIVIDPEVGELACRTYGPGRMAEPHAIVDAMVQRLSTPRDFEHLKVLVTAGPTRESIDPVRFISNPASGKMGFALAREARNRGAEVTLVSGPTWLTPPSGVTFHSATSAADMDREVAPLFDGADVVIMTAAVADYRPERTEEHKIKKEAATELTLRLIPAKDILLEMGQRKTKQFLVGFAAETQDFLANARAKMLKKRLDMVVVNDVARHDAGFAVDTNQVTVIDADGVATPLPMMTKDDAAVAILDHIKKRLV